MRQLRLLLRSAVFAALATGLLVTPSYAGGSSPAPSPKGVVPIAPLPAADPGICAPWHACVAKGILASVLLYLLATAGMYMLQRRGFDSVEHKQGSPDGVPVKK